jgi:murein DD-endopeptidase MepM/ murein hydrolase activator NlpD
MGDGSVKSTSGSLGSGERKERIGTSTKDTRDFTQRKGLQTTPLTTASIPIPEAPSNLTATILNNTSIALYWHDNSTVESGFKIERKIGNGRWIQIATIKKANSTTFTNNYYIDNTVNTISNTYYYRISAYNSSGNSNYSNEALAISPPTSDGFDFPVGNADGNGSYARYDNGRECTSTIGGFNWYVAYDVIDPGYWNHTGEDWNGACGGDTDRGQPVYAVSAGRVVYAGYIPNEWGNVILIVHRLSSGEIVYTQYAHLERIEVSAGTEVNRRQLIGTIGKGANNYSAHLHFEVRRTTIGAGNWPNNKNTIENQYYDPSDRTNDRWSASGFIERHRRWVNRASMPTARSWAPAVEYKGKIYVVGGCSSTQPQQFKNPVANLEMYDPEKDTWTRLSPMTSARVGPSVAVLNGKIYVMGGFDPKQYWSANPTVEIYDIKTDRWSMGPSMPTGVSWASAVVLDGKIYVLGGVGSHYYDIMQIFDPSTKGWSYGQSFNGGRYRHAAVAYGGKIYLIGGDTWETGSNIVYNDIQVYDPVSKSWSAKRPMPTAATGLSAVAWKEKIYLFASNGFARVYDIASDSWEEVTFSNQDPSSDFSTRVYNGVIYRFGGGGWGPTTSIVQSLIPFHASMGKDLQWGKR